MYRELADAAEVTGDSRYAGSGAEVWYMKPEVFRDFIMGPDFLREQGVELPTARTISKTHILVGEVGERNPDRVYDMMQGENWSPGGEARQMIQRLGLRHTSMSVGDCIVVGSRLFMTGSVGFEKLAKTKIASPEDLASEIKKVLAYSEGHEPRRLVVARWLQLLADRLEK